MENASKALLIAGGVLLTMLLLSLFVYVTGKTAGYTSNIYGMLEESDITQFNQKFLYFQERAEGLDYEGNINGLTMQEVISLAHLAINCNKKDKMPVTVTVQLIDANISSDLPAGGYISKVTENGSWKEENLEKLLEKHFDFKYGKCEIGYAPQSKLVEKIVITNRIAP